MGFEGARRHSRGELPYCPRNSPGFLVGALAGGTLGNVIAPNGSKTVGSLIGGSLGAIPGKELDDGIECR